MTMLVVICAVWGGNMVSIKVSNQGLPAILAAFIRSVLAAFLLWAWVRMRGMRVALEGRDVVHGAVIGVLFGLDFLFFYWGLEFTHASRATICLYTHPFWTAIGAHFLLKDDRLTVTKSIGLVLAFFGVAALFGSKSSDLGPLYWLGDIMLLVAALFWAATTLYLKKFLARPEINHRQTLFAQLFFSAPVLLLSWLIIEPHSPVTLTTPVIVALGYQTIIVAFVSYLVWFWLIHRYQVSILTAFTFLTPLFGVIASGLYLGEELPLLLWVGLGLVAVGIYLVNRPARSLPAETG